MDMPLISVIVPVYKVEKYLDRCVQSIVDQTYSNLEIILVDDGSPDNCGAMCDAWAEKDSRIKVIHKENGGGAQARNVGLDCAAGKYIGFVDSDDYILPEMYKALVSVCQSTDSDITECGYITFENEEEIKSDASSGAVSVYNTEQALRENIGNKTCCQIVWNKVYKREVLANVRFVEGKLIDDEFFTYRALGNARRVSVVPVQFYCYRQQLSSIMHQTYSLKWLAAVEAKQNRHVYLKESYTDLLDASGINLMFTCMYHGQLALRDLEKKDADKALDWLQSVVRETYAGSHGQSAVRKCWLLLARINLKICCRLRNILGVGV